MMDRHNLFDDIPASLPEELFTTLRSVDGVRIERIVSQGHCSPEGFWYDQPEHEWVIVIEGRAAVEFEGNPAPIVLGQSSHLFIPAHQRHRVAWTSPREKTVWLAVHVAPSQRIGI